MTTAAPAFTGATGRLRHHPRALAAVALAIATGVVIAIAAATGFGAVGASFARIRPAWLVLVAAAQVVGVLGYALAYRAVASVTAKSALPFPVVLRLVAAGFGAYTVGGGFVLDYYAWRGAGQSGRSARIRVLGLGVVEYAVLAPAACVSAIIMLAEGSKAEPSLLWPWALAVPIGAAIALAAVSKHERLIAGRHGRRRRLDEALRALEVLRDLATRRAGVAALAGMAVYWAAEIISLWAALELFATHVSAPALIVAYATGYAATRRTLPLGGAGTTEVLLTLALHWVRVPMASALTAVVAYRVFNFALATLPALRARASIEPLFSSDREDARTLVA